MPVQPHPIEITVYDTDNSTLKQSAKVYVRNCTKKTESSEETTDSAGVAMIDLANLPLGDGQSNQYDAGDEILIIAYHGHDSDAEKYTVAGTDHTSTLYLNPIRHDTGLVCEKITTLIVANTHASNAYYAKVYAKNDGKLLTHVECPASDTKVVPAGGMGGNGGFLVQRENQALLVTVVTK